MLTAFAVKTAFRGIFRPSLGSGNYPFGPGPYHQLGAIPIVVITTEGFSTLRVLHIGVPVGLRKGQ
ncbi:hypothetical protein FACS1894130_01030 [Spirochaetia bacterium]|nr:hypothetical protein FACS1894130_01030 [Spirochaetia bacterium]